MRGRKTFIGLILVISVFLSGFTFSSHCSNPYYLSSFTTTTAKELRTFPISAEYGIYFDYYIRNVNAKIFWDNLTLDFFIKVRGIAPIIEVIFSYTSLTEESWFNKTMSKFADKEYIYRHIHDFRLPNRENPYNWLVKYYAQDADGRWSTTESVSITLEWHDFPDTPRSTRVSSPQDITYELGTVGHSIEWNHISQYEGQSYEIPEQYMLWQDGYLLEWMQWPNEGLSVNIDGLSIGTYRYQLTAIIGSPWLHTYSDQVQVDVVTGVPGEGSNPSMRYYLRKYSIQMYIIDNFSLPLQILVEDVDGVEEVFVVYSIDDGPWSNESMSEISGEVGWYESDLDFPSFELYEEHSIDVRYTAKDILGNWAMTPLCEYSIYANPVTADIGVEVYDTPDLWYLVGTTGHTITWSSTAGFSYSLYEDNHLIESASWSDPFTINVDGLEIGDHVFRLCVSGGGWSDSDTVTAHVVNSTEYIPLGAYTESVGPDMLFNPYTPILGIPILIWMVILGISGVIMIVIIWRYLKRNK